MVSKLDERSHGTGDSKTARRTSQLAAVPEPTRSVKAERAQRLVQTELSFIHSAEFEQIGAVKEILGGGQIESPLQARRRKAPRNVPGHLAHLWEVALLKPEEEQDLFRRMNFQKYRANALRSCLNPGSPNVRVMDRIEEYLDDARMIRDYIIQANLRLIVSIARRFVNNFTTLGELISDGNLILMKVVDRFDYSRGFRFSTYATHSVQRDFYQSYKNFRRRQAKEIVTDPDVLHRSVQASETADQKIEDAQTVACLKNLMSRYVNTREMRIVNMRYGLDSEDGGQTLREVGEKLNLSKERVRQLQTRAIKQVRELALTEMHDID